MSTPYQKYQELISDHKIHPDPHQKKAIEHLHRLHAAITEKAQSRTSKFWPSWRKKEASHSMKGLYIHGSVGRGKSMLMDLFYDCLPAAVPKKRAHFHEFMISVHDYLHKARQGDEADKAVTAFAKEISEQAKVLCFDEFHVTDIADAMILGRLFGALFARGVVVISTSNWPPCRLYENGLQRERFLPFIDLLKSSMDVLALDGPIDYRLQNMAEADIYFWPLGQNAQRKMDEIFRSLAKGTPPAVEKITVKGRDIHVLAAGKTARFTFAELCEKPHGAEDYLNISNKYDTVLIEKIPKLGYDRRNEAKRFMILIDALYEAQCNLVVSADAPIEKLYTGADHAFEFERTISRIIEMQSEDYRHGNKS
jgi:cell division protein ZapE